MAGPTGIILTKIPIRIRPPSIPKIEDKKAVPSVARTMRTRITRFIIKL
jgi:hypothetical protein